MPEGALLTGTVESVLLDLAGQAATGACTCATRRATRPRSTCATGVVYAVMVPGRRTMLGVRLMSRGALTPEALAEALEIQRTELQGWRLGELLVHLGYVDLEVVEEFVVEHLKDALADLLGWPVAAWKFRKNKKTRQDVAPPTAVDALLDDLHDRRDDLGDDPRRHRRTRRGADARVRLVLGRGRAGPERVGAAVQGRRRSARVADLAAECGFTLFEAGQVVMVLSESGMVSLVAGWPRPSLTGSRRGDRAAGADRAGPAADRGRPDDEDRRARRTRDRAAR